MATLHHLPWPGGRREAIKSAQGLRPARRVRHRHRQAGGHMQEIVYQVLFLKLEGQEKRKKRKKFLPGGRSLTKKYTKRQCFFVNFQQK